EQTADVAEVRFRRPQAERGAACGDEQPAQSRQVRNELVGQGACEWSVAFVIADEAERQDSERWPQHAFRAIRHLAQPFGFRRAHDRNALHGAGLPYEAITLAMKRLDQLLRPAVLAEGLARRFHPARTRGRGEG